ncbi:MAG: hypothetical protein FWE23_03600 [Chitinivibrionia bacterium]|nr:hypothetical protein [Chitinivibrionia bacterium]
MGKFTSLKFLAAILVIVGMVWGQTTRFGPRGPRGGNSEQQVSGTSAVSASMFSVIDDNTGTDWAATEITITTEEQLRVMASLVNSDTRNFEGQTIILDNNINLNGSSANPWTPIGNSSRPFNGIFDGNNNVISGVFIQVWNSNRGFFGSIGQKGVVKNLGVDVNITMQNWGDNIGGLAGQNSGTIRNSHTSGTITTWSNNAGGLVGNNNGTIENSYSSVNVNGGQSVGGLVGQNFGTIRNSYAVGNVSGSWEIGGLAGQNNGTIINSFALEGASSALVGHNNGTITGNTELRTAAQMKTQTTYTNWSFVCIWQISAGENDGFPRLRPSGEHNWNDWGTWNITTAGTCHSSGSRTRTMTCRTCSEQIVQTEVIPAGHDWSAWAQVIPAGAETNGQETRLCQRICGTSPETRIIPATMWNADNITVSTETHLRNLAAVVNSGVRDFEGQTIVLANDIELEGGQWISIGNSNSASSFSGIFDGNGRIVSGLEISNNGEQRGFFGTIGQKATVKNLGVEVNITGWGWYVGGLAGENFGTIQNSYIKGNVSGNEWIGGFVSVNNGIISNSYSLATVSASWGGIGGFAVQNSGTITNSYALQGTASQFVAWSGSSTTNSGFRTAEQLKTPATFNTWDTENIWGIAANTNDGFPHLRVWGNPGDWVGDVAATCAADGSRKRARTCQRCNSAGEEIEAIAALGCSMPADWTVIAATCATEGSRTKTCTRACGHYIRETIAIDHNAHAWGEWTTTTAATCAAEGSKRRVCSRNNTHVESAPLPKLDHLFTNWTITTQPTCKAAGELTGRCSRTDCEETSRQSIPAISTNHDWGNWSLIKLPTRTEEGQLRRVCKLDATHVETLPIDKLEYCDRCDRPIENCNCPPVNITSNRRSNERNHGILFTNPVSESAELHIVLPDNEDVADAKIVIFDAAGNIVHNVETQCLAFPNCTVIWNLQNQSGRFVANGTYLIVVEATSAGGRRFTYSSRIGVNR